MAIAVNYSPMPGISSSDLSAALSGYSRIGSVGILPFKKRSFFAQPKAALAEQQQQREKQLKAGTWNWQHKSKNVKIHYVEQVKDDKMQYKDLLFLPTISDVSTVEEWEKVSTDMITRDSPFNWRTLTIDWPGFGLSDRQSLDYTADFMEEFLVDFMSAKDGPLGSSPGPAPIVIAGGHAATVTIRALTKNYINANAVVAVAPTWAGPMPIVFGRSEEAESRYKLMYNGLRAPGVGWAMYNLLVSSAGNIRKQYESHVYADPSHVTEEIVQKRLALTKREGARYAPAAFLTGLLDPVQTREEFVSLFAGLEGKVPTLVLFSRDSPKRSKAEMEALKGAKGVTKFVEVPGALLPQEEYPKDVADQIHAFVQFL